ncbi:MAG: hypothetical protein AAB686_03845, partial [Patescibacteria group bacterium]
GAPTSPHMFNLVVVAQQTPTIIQQALLPFQGSHPFIVTFYADNVTASTHDETIPEEARRKVIEAVELETPFRINPRKTRYTELRHGSPSVTGLSFGENGLTVPQRTQKKARGLMHSATLRLDPELRSQAMGWAAYLLNVYGGIDLLPMQIRDPYLRLMAVVRPQSEKRPY